jgi:hypothetical protein
LDASENQDSFPKIGHRELLPLGQYRAPSSTHPFQFQHPHPRVRFPPVAAFGVD